MKLQAIFQALRNKHQGQAEQRGTDGESVIPGDLEPLFRHIQHFAATYEDRFVSTEITDLQPKLMEIFLLTMNRQQEWDDALREQLARRLEELSSKVDRALGAYQAVIENKFLPLHAEVVQRHQLAFDDDDVGHDNTPVIEAFKKQILELNRWYYGQALLADAQSSIYPTELERIHYSATTLLMTSCEELDEQGLFSPHLMMAKLHYWQQFLLLLRSYVPKAIEPTSIRHWNSMVDLVQAIKGLAKDCLALEDDALYFADEADRTIVADDSPDVLRVLRGQALHLQQRVSDMTFYLESCRKYASKQKKSCENLGEKSVLQSFLREIKTFQERLTMPTQLANRIFEHVDRRCQAVDVTAAQMTGASQVSEQVISAQSTETVSAAAPVAPLQAIPQPAMSVPAKAQSSYASTSTSLRALIDSMSALRLDDAQEAENVANRSAVGNAQAADHEDDLGSRKRRTRSPKEAAETMGHASPVKSYMNLRSLLGSSLRPSPSASPQRMHAALFATAHCSSSSSRITSPDGKRYRPTTATTASTVKDSSPVKAPVFA